jgi:phosphatidylinositol glycan class A protein
MMMMKSTTTITHQQKQRYNICMVSDFSFPGFGGVESHLLSLCMGLMKLGHNVIIITKSFDDRNGIRYMTNGLKVYHIPILTLDTGNGKASLPLFYSLFPIYRQIWIREQIDIVHGHQCTGGMGMEALTHARVMGLRTVFTDHSLFGFGDAAGIHINKLMTYVLSDVDQMICVSHTSRDNLVLRAGVNPYQQMSVIPHAVDTGVFKPIAKSKSTKNQSDKILIVVTTRLVYRKGADLLAFVIPIICHKHPNVNFLIVGDGPKRILIEQMREQNKLFDRVEMRGALPHAQVKTELRKGHIFLNTSLTEAFCLAILEASSVGLLVVSTAVGGVPEVLPDDLAILCEATTQSIVKALERAIVWHKRIDDFPKVQWERHRKIKQMYNWDSVALRTAAVYEKTMALDSNSSLWHRLQCVRSGGYWFGQICSLLAAAGDIFNHYLEWTQPRDDIDICPKFPVTSLETFEDPKIENKTNIRTFFEQEEEDE